MLNMPEPRKRHGLRESFGRGPVNHTTDDQVHYRNFTLDPSQEVYQRLRLRADLAHIPEERWSHPVARFFRCDMLVLFSELEEIFAASGRKTSKDQLKKVPKILSDGRRASRMCQIEPSWGEKNPVLSNELCHSRADLYL